MNRQKLGIVLIGVALIGFLGTWVVQSGVVSAVGANIQNALPTSPSKSSPVLVASAEVVVSGREKAGASSGITAKPGDTIVVECIENCYTVTFVPATPDGQWYLYFGSPGQMTEGREGPQTQSIAGASIWPGWERLYQFGHCNTPAGAVVVVLGSVNDAPCGRVIPISNGRSVEITSNTTAPQEITLYLHDAQEYWELVGTSPQFTRTHKHHVYAWPQKGTTRVDGYTSNPEHHIRFRISVFR